MALAPQKPTFFASPARWRAWLQKNHDKQSELWLGLMRVKAGRGLEYKAALDEALCFGWIDGVRKSIDAERWMIRFTPRKPNSYWSSVNIRKAEALVAAGRMAPAGLAAFAKRDQSAARRYSFENRARALGAAERAELAAQPKAAAFHDAQPPWYQRACAFWVMSAVKPETRARRLAELIERSSKGKRIGMLERPGKPARR